MLEPTTQPAAVTPTGCCPPFDPGPWQDKEITWENKLFLEDRCASVFHVPLGMGRHILKDMARIEAAHAEGESHLMLSDDQSPWHTDLFIEVSRPVEGAKMATISGRFLTRVFEGPYREMGRWAEETARWVKERGEVLDRLYFGYTTCPACAKAYGKNYIVAFARLREPADA